MKIKISVLLPTRGRRHLAERFMSSAGRKALFSDHIEFILYVDDDDVDSKGIYVDNLNFRIIVGPRCEMGICNTRCLEESTGDIIILANDDVVIRTTGWDEKIRLMHKSINDHIYLAYPNDLNKGERLSAFPILSRKTCSLISQPFPMIFKGAFIDTHLMEIFIRLKRMDQNKIIYLEDIIFEHLHFRTGKVEVDKTYMDRGRFADDMTFLALHDVRKSTAKFLHDVINKKVSDTDKYQFIEPKEISQQSSFFSIFCLLKNSYLKDSGLPFGYRIKSFIYYQMRWIFAWGLKILKL